MAPRLGRFVGIALLVLATLPNARLLAQTDPGSDPAWTTGWTGLGGARSLLLDPSNPSHLFAGTELGLATSTDGGRTWSIAPGTPPILGVLALDPSNSSRLFGGSDSGVFRSTDAGAHFTLTESKATSTIAIDPSHPQTVYAGGGDDSLVRKSTDGGQTWTSMSTAFAQSLAIASLLVDPSNPDKVMAGTTPGDTPVSYYYAPFGPSVIGSVDAGRSWRIFLDNSGPAIPVNALALDPRTSDVVYAAKGAVVYRSTDGGATWVAGTFTLGSVISSLTVDSMNPNTLYAGTDQGVFRSTDAGAHWAPLSAPPNRGVTSLALDAAGQVLHAATPFGVYELGLRAEAPSYPCQPNDRSLCLLGARFRVRAQAWNRRTGVFTNGTAVPQSDGFGYFSLPDFTGDPTLPEVLMKMVDAQVPPWNDNWVFFDGLTDAWYLLTVTDTVTGEIRSYQNDPDSPYCGGADTAAFPAATLPHGAAPPPSASVRLSPQGNTLSLLSGRFALTLSATDPHTQRAVEGAAIARGAGFGYFSLPDLTGDPSLPEVVVKMVDGRPLTGTFWIFVSGLTSVEYTLTLRDSETGLSRSYSTAGAFCGAADTSIPGTP